MQAAVPIHVPPHNLQCVLSQHQPQVHTRLLQQLLPQLVQLVIPAPHLLLVLVSEGLGPASGLRVMTHTHTHTHVHMYMIAALSTWFCAKD